jgi:hypothetical protein
MRPGYHESAPRRDHADRCVDQQERAFRQVSALAPPAPGDV